MDISVVIVNYKTYDLTKNCIESVLEAFDYGDLKGEIIVVDNNSEDGSVERLKETFKNNSNIKIIANSANEGFSKANNIGLKEATGEHLLLLNSDTVVEKDTLKSSLDYLKNNPEYSVLGCKILLGNGELDKACKRSFPTPMGALFHFTMLDKAFPKSKLFGSYNLTYLDEDEINEVDCLSGAFILLDREVYEKIGGLSEDYFMYGEDNDYCYRIKEAGFKTIYYPETQITHYKKSSWNGKKNPEVLKAFYDSMLIFYDKFYKDKYSDFTTFLVKTGVTTFKTIDLLKNKFL